MPITKRSRITFLLGLGLLATTACTPKVQVEAPDKPIEINLNVNIDHRIRVEMEKDVKQAIAKNPNLF